eukprot:gene17072-20291_t
MTDPVVISFVAGYGPMDTGVTAKPAKKAKAPGKPVTGSVEGVTMDFASDKLHYEFTRALKSVLHLSSSNIHLVVFTNDLGKSMIQKDIMDPLSHLKDRICWTPIMIEPNLIKNYIDDMGFSLWTPRWALVKPYAYTLLPPEIDWIIQLDTDVILATDILELWDLRLQYNSTQTVGGAQEIMYIQGKKKFDNKGIHIPDVTGLNSGVILYSAHRMRDLKFSRDLILEANRRLYPEWKNPDKVHPEKYRQLDQDLYNTVLKVYPHLKFTIPLKWNLQGCGGYDRQEKLKEGVGLYHFNCLRRQIDDWRSVKDLQRSLDGMSLEQAVKTLYKPKYTARVK